MSYEFPVVEEKTKDRSEDSFEAKKQPPRPTEAQKQQEQREHESTAAEICQLGDYAKILETFALPENAGLLESQIVILKNRYGSSRLTEASRHLQGQDWEMLTILELFDHTTFEHCLRTYETAHQKITSSEAVGAYLRTHIADEGFTPWDIELACLLHDMGKVALAPKDLILNNVLKNEEWHTLFEGFCKNNLEPADAAAKIATYNKTLAAHPELREKDITPLSIVLTPAERERLETLSIDTNLPLGKLIAKHQDISVDIVRRYYSESAILELIGNHHERVLAPDEPAPVSQSAVRISSIVNAIRIADIYDAFHRARPYKGENPIMMTLAFLVQKTKDGFIDDELTRLWIDADLKKFDAKAYLHNLHKEHDPALADSEAAAYQTVHEYLHSSPADLKI